MSKQQLEELIVVVDTRFGGNFDDDPILQTRSVWEKKVSDYCKENNVSREKADKQFIVRPVVASDPAMKLIDQYAYEYAERVKDDIANWLRYEATVKTVQNIKPFHDGQYVDILDVFKKIERPRVELSSHKEEKRNI